MYDDTTRRRFLATSGLLATTALAGCANLGSSDDSDDGMSDTTTESMDDGMSDTTTESMDDDMGDDMDDGMGPTDPAAAHRASVDRYSEAAGTLMIRTAENGLPGPDEPIDFDQAPFRTKGLGPSGNHVSYYNFDVQPTDPAPIYAIFREGEDTPVEGQLNVVDVKPGDDGYNDFWHVHTVTVPADYEANTVTSVEAIMDAGYDVTPTDVVKNCPIVPQGSTASMRYGDGTAELVDGWYDGMVVSYFLFEEAPLTLAGDAVPLSPIYVAFNTNPGEDGGGPPSGFMTEMDGDRTHNVVASLPGDADYSPLWLVNIYDNADFESVADLDSATDADILASGAATVNCPIVAIDGDTM
jgi:hypothetical protein